MTQRQMIDRDKDRRWIETKIDNRQRQRQMIGRDKDR